MVTTSGLYVLSQNCSRDLAIKHRCTDWRPKVRLPRRGCAQQDTRAPLTQVPRTTTLVTKALTMGFYKSTATGGAMMARLQEPRTHVESSVMGCAQQNTRAALTHVPRTTIPVIAALTMGFYKSTATGGAMMARLQEPRTHVESSVVRY
ncbi:hypothetical protein KIL84_018507 [Mauremys mutica]|uniref:Uncharacterized protein n=1 Tax=Mauremys mutica TaxID=74926 RepID=A0A9D4B930_9SAUR|nr:hypothetical protein KIL84_018507 [Mauremys mutica]